MSRKLYLLLVTLLASGLIAIGCGDDDDDGGGSDEPAQEETSASTSTSEDTSTTEDTDGSLDSDAAKAAKEGCEASIKDNPTIDASKQDELSEECQKVADAAATGDTDKYKDAYSKFCNKLAEALPAEAQEATKAACQQTVDAIK